MSATACKFIVAGTQRTGTTLIRTSLDSHPQVSCHGEVFKLGRSPYARPDGYWSFTRSGLARRLTAMLAPRRSVSAYLERLYSAPGHDAIGFKLMLSHCRARPHVWQLTAAHCPKVIHVTRRNGLKTLVSRRAAAASGVYHVSESLPARTAVREWSTRAVALDPQSLLRDLDAIADESRQWRDLLGGLGVLEVVYEEFVRDPAGQSRRMTDFLGVAPQTLSSDLRKVNTDRLSEAIANLDDVRAALEGSAYANCLEPDR